MSAELTWSSCTAQLSTGVTAGVAWGFRRSRRTCNQESAVVGGFNRCPSGSRVAVLCSNRHASCSMSVSPLLRLRLANCWSRHGLRVREEGRRRSRQTGRGPRHQKQEVSTLFCSSCEKDCLERHGRGRHTHCTPAFFAFLMHGRHISSQKSSIPRLECDQLPRGYGQWRRNVDLRYLNRVCSVLP